MIFDTEKFVAFDLETHLIEPGRLTPKIVCGSSATWLDCGDGPATEGELHGYHHALEFARGVLASDKIIVGANVVYDFGCLVAADPSFLPLVFKAYEEGRVYDVQLAQALHAIAEGNLYADPLTGKPLQGRYSLDRCVDFVLGRQNAKANDDWRLRYAELDGVPFSEWPPEALQYPVDDAVNTLEVALAQVLGGGGGVTPGPHRNLCELSAQAETAWALHLGAIWGVRTDPERVQTLRKKTETEHKVFVERFQKLGFFKEDEKTGELKEDRAAVKQAVILAYGGGSACEWCATGPSPGKVLSEKSGKPVNCKDCSGTGLDPGPTPRTPTGGVCADRDAKIESGDPDLAALGDNEPEKVRDTYLPFLETGVERPITLRPNVMVATLRTSYDGLIQLLPREGDVRGCFVARPGRVFCSVDYAALELCTLAQVCYWILGRSQMMETINATGDPGALHTALAAGMAGVTPEAMQGALKDPARKDEAKRYRQAAKALNFGLPGGMGAAKLVLAKRKKSEGFTVCEGGPNRNSEGQEGYYGVRFCVLLGGAKSCGSVKVTEWRRRSTPPICRACVELVDSELRPAWFRQWPEIQLYFDWVSNRVEFGGGEFPFFTTDGAVRGGCDFTNGANNGFQSLAGIGAKAALRAVARECYLGVTKTGEPSPLRGGRPIFFLHDEIFSELIETTASDAAIRKAKLMVTTMREVACPDVCVSAEPALMRHWDKRAEPAYRDGILVPWEDR